MKFTTFKCNPIKSTDYLTLHLLTSHIAKKRRKLLWEYKVGNIANFVGL